MARPKDIGTFAETHCCAYLKANFCSTAERRTLSGSNDKGDIGGIPKIVVEVKNCKTLSIPAWLREAETERVNAGADVGFVVYKPAGAGAKNVGRWFAVFSGDVVHSLMASCLTLGGAPRVAWDSKKAFGKVAGELAHYEITMSLEHAVVLLLAAGYGDGGMEEENVG